LQDLSINHSFWFEDLLAQSTLLPFSPQPQDIVVGLLYRFLLDYGYQYTIHLARIEDWIVLTNPQNTFAPNKAKLEEF